MTIQTQQIDAQGNPKGNPNEAVPIGQTIEYMIQVPNNLNSFNAIMRLEKCTATSATLGTTTTPVDIYKVRITLKNNLYIL